MKIILILSCFFMSAHLQAWNCKFEKEIDQTLDLENSEELVVMAAAGDLEIRGVDNGPLVSIKGKVCVSKEKWLDEARVETRGGERAEIVVELPDTDGVWSLAGGQYAYLDLVLEVPDGVSIDIKDSSGDIDIRGVGELSVKDSSGDIEIVDARQSVTVKDSSGDIVFRDIEGDVTIESDSSGDIRGEEVEGSVLVKSDSSGDIRFKNVGRDFIVERDSSGDISARGVGGDFRVLSDGSGDVVATDVSGSVVTPEG